VIEQGDDDDTRMFSALRALRRLVVQVSEDFGTRLSVRLLALAAARDKGDPSLLTIFASVMSEAVNLITEPLSPRLERDPAPEAPSPEPVQREKDDDDDA
jgi:hypothetical protein